MRPFAQGDILPRTPSSGDIGQRKSASVSGNIVGDIDLPDLRLLFHLAP